MRPIVIAAALALAAAPVAGGAVLSVGAKAPDFQTQGAVGGKTFTLKLSEQLKKGPVVLYFFPAAFTPVCTIEAHQFADATDDFKKAGAQVIGMANDPIDKLADFSVKECRNKFPVAVATPALINAYDVKLGPIPNLPPDVVAKMAGRSSRTSYVIAPGGKVLLAYSDMSPDAHVSETLAAVKNWKARRPK